MHKQNEIKFSVIIPTYSSWGKLSKCLAALNKQTYDQDKFEVIVVNNLPGDKPPCTFLNNLNNIRIIEESSPGSYAARNKGVESSKFRYLAFTDSDCIPTENWLQELAKKIMHSETYLVSGKVNIFPKNADMINMVEAYDIALGINQHLYFKKGLAATANLAMKREVFDLVDGFDSTLLSGGDMDFCRRAKLEGIKLVYNDLAIVHHPARNSWGELREKVERISGARAKVKGKDFLRYLISIISPPIVRIHIIVKNSDLSNKYKLKALLVLLFVKIIQFKEYFAVLLFNKKPKR